MKKILVPTSGIVATYESAKYVMQVASVVNAEVHVLHVVQQASEIELIDDSVNQFESASEELGIRLVGRVGIGKVAEQIIRYAEANEVSLILMGASNGVVVESWLSYEVLGHTSIPVLVMPYQVFSAEAVEAENTVREIHSPHAFGKPEKAGRKHDSH